MKKIEAALKRFQAIVESLECECDAFHRYTCTIYSDIIYKDFGRKEIL